MMAIVQNSSRLQIHIHSTYVFKSSEMQLTGSVSETRINLLPFILYYNYSIYRSDDVVSVLFYIGYETNEFRNFLIMSTLLSIYVIHV